MQVFDITRTLRPGMPTYPGEPGPSIRLIKEMANGHPADVSELTLGVHTGTHVDAPRHFIPGAAGAETLELSVLVGPATVVDIRDPAAIRAAELATAGLDGAERVLFRTRNSQISPDAEFTSDFVYLDPEAARWLIDHGVRLIGVDYLSVEQFDAAEPLTHPTLLGAEIVIIEGLDLHNVTAGAYTLACLPLKLANADGAPARVILMRD